MRSGNDRSLAGEAYGIVKRRIIRGELGIGQAVSRRKIAGELGMSFLPVSEALLRLELEGLLESRPRAGTRVKIPTREDVRGHYVVREALEVQVARLFVESATAEERGELSRLASSVDVLRARPASDRVLFLTLHEKLHRRIAECARCPRLSEAIENTHALASTWLCVSGPDQPDSQSHRHGQLMKVLVGADPEAAALAMREHTVVSMEHAMQRLEPYFEMQKAHDGAYRRVARG
ncbi:MAG: GntR family transcriptional regulator [Bryobacteraceae bacterium]